MTTKALTGAGAAYLRISTEDQSTEHQTRAITRWLTDRGQTVTPSMWITDEGWSRSDDDVRPGFRRLLALVEQGKIQWVVIYNSDRFGHATNLRLMRTLSVMESRGVSLWSVTEPEMGNLASSDVLPMILATLNSSRSVGEIYNKAVRAIEGVVTHAGNAIGNLPLYGYDKVCVRPDGKERWRLILERHEGKMPIKVRLWPDGRRDEFRGAGHNPGVDDGDRMRLAPSVHADRVAVVRLAFELFTTRQITPTAIAKILAATPGLNPPPNPVPKFSDQFVRQLLANPTYCYGAAVRCRRTNAQHAEWRDGRVQPVAKLPGARVPTGRKRDRSDWVLPPQSERAGGLVGEEVWEAAYAKLTNKPKGQAVAPRNPARWLSGLLVCGGCGLPMRSVTATKRKRNKQTKCGYACRTYYTADRRAGTPCRHNFVREEVVEGIITRYLKDTGERLDVLEKTPAAVIVEMAEALVADSACAQSLRFADVLPPGDPFREASVSLEDGVGRYTRLLTQVWRETKESKRKGQKSPLSAAGLVAEWEQQHHGRAGRLAMELAAAEESLGTMVDNFATLRAGPARDRLQRRIEEQEAAVARLREAMVPLTERLREAGALVARCREALAEVRRLLLAEDGVSLKRRSGDVLRKLIRRITVSFRPHDVPKKGGGIIACSVPTTALVTPMVGESRELQVPKTASRCR